VSGPPTKGVERLSQVQTLALVHVRAGRLPVGALEAVAEADGSVLVVGSGAGQACDVLTAPNGRWFAEASSGMEPGRLAAQLAGLVDTVPLVVLPGSPDGRDLAPRLAAELGRPLLANASRVALALLADGSTLAVRADLARMDARLLVHVEVDGPAVATLLPGSRAPLAGPASGPPCEVALHRARGSRGDSLAEATLAEAILVEEREADVATMDLAEASRVLGGGYGLAAGCDDVTARSLFSLLGAVAAKLGASLGATRVVTDAGWVDHGRQVGTTGVAIDPDLYVAFGVSGASQHLGGIGSPRTVVSVNLDPSCPMTKMADLGIVTDARALLVELAKRLGVGLPEAVARG